MRSLAFAVLTLLPAVVFGQFDPGGLKPGFPGRKAKSFADVGEVGVTVEPAKAAPGEVVTVRLTVTPKTGCTTYPFFISQTSQNRFTPEAAAGNPLVFVGPLKNPDGTEPKGSGAETEQAYKHAATWELTAVVLPTAPPAAGPLPLKGFRIQACSDSACFYESTLSAPLEITPGPAREVPTGLKPWVDAHLAGKPRSIEKADATAPPAEATAPKGEVPTGLVSKPPLPAAEYSQKLDALAATLGTQAVAHEGGLVGLLLTAAFWGFVSLATPCVFPMIPITVSLFLKQSNQSIGGAARLAGVYCLTIVVVLGASAVLLLSVFRALSVDPWMNVALGTLFVVFALSLFGMYEITLPNFLLRRAEAGRKRGGLAGTVFGAVAFSIVSFTCVAPFLGGFAGLAASGQFSQVELILAGVTYAVAFASPFFVLALVPSLLKKLPRSGGWMDTVKAVMGFLELAAALKFFRTAELRWSPLPAVFTYDLVLVGWVAIAAVCGAYLLGLFRLPHDEPHDRISVPRLLAGLLFLGLGVYLLPGVLKGADGKPQRPGGVVFAWVDAFLLPEPSAAGGGSGLAWGTDLPDALKKAGDDGQRTGTPKLVFVDFTGVTCTNCKANEGKVFPQPAVHDLMRRYALVQMYTDDVPADFYASAVTNGQRNAEAQANLAFQKKVFGTEQLPLYVILEPTTGGGAKVRGVYSEGLINDVPGFVKFLEEPLKK